MLIDVLVPTAVAVATTAWGLLAEVTGEAEGSRWDPQWLAILVIAAVVLVSLAVLWWLFLVVRVQDRWRGDDVGRRRRR